MRSRAALEEAPKIITPRPATLHRDDRTLGALAAGIADQTHAEDDRGAGMRVFRAPRSQRDGSPERSREGFQVEVMGKLAALI